jgi:hypothetical protein
MTLFATEARQAQAGHATDFRAARASDWKLAILKNMAAICGATRVGSSDYNREHGSPSEPYLDGSIDCRTWTCQRNYEWPCLVLCGA